MFPLVFFPFLPPSLTQSNSFDLWFDERHGFRHSFGTAAFLPLFVSFLRRPGRFFVALRDEGSVSNATIVLLFVHCRPRVPEVPHRPLPPPPPPPRGDTGNFPSPRGIHSSGGGRTKLQRLLLQKQNCGVGGVAVGAGRGTRHREEADNAASTQGCNSIPFVQIWTSTVAIQHKSQMYTCTVFLQKLINPSKFTTALN